MYSAIVSENLDSRSSDSHPNGKTKLEIIWSVLLDSCVENKLVAKNRSGNAAKVADGGAQETTRNSCINGRQSSDRRGWGDFGGFTNGRRAIERVEVALDPFLR